MHFGCVFNNVDIYHKVGCETSQHILMSSWHASEHNLLCLYILLEDFLQLVLKGEKILLPLS